MSTDTNSLQAAAWEATGDLIAAARAGARLKERAGRQSEADTAMLSARYTLLGRIRAKGGLLNLVLVPWHLALGERRAQRMLSVRARLSENQLEVLAAWMLATRRVREAVSLSKTALDMARVGYREGRVKPHALALIMLLALRAHAALGGMRAPDAKRLLGEALALEGPIRAESDRLYALRQLVRVWKQAGEFCIAHLGDRELGTALLSSARLLAEGDAKAPDQAAKVRSTMRTLGITPIATALGMSAY